ncbi:MAG: hypothetical protein U5S82_18295 [Gammaproteobacteria bacterium]|nr:hypothetical protein [Gammaproteobacteria bacterium]
MSTRLERFTQKARAEPQLRFTSLMGMLFDPEGLHASFERGITVTLYCFHHFPLELR